MALVIKKATKSQAKARIALIGPSGSGKTYTSLLLATELAGEGEVLLVDTEHGSASKYADEFTFDVIELESFSPMQYMEAMDLAERQQYAVVVIDSLSHAWAGKGGILEFVDQTVKRSRSGSTFSEGWREASPLHNQLVERLLSLSERRHLIVTMRSKMQYVLETDEKGRQRPKKVGMQPVQRDGVEYEFDIVGDLDLDNALVISKTRCKLLNKAYIPTPGVDLARTIQTWLSDGAPRNGDSNATVTQYSLTDLIQIVKEALRGEEDLLAQMKQRGYPEKRKDLSGEQINELYAHFAAIKAGQEEILDFHGPGTLQDETSPPAETMDTSPPDERASQGQSGASTPPAVPSITLPNETVYVLGQNTPTPEIDDDDKEVTVEWMQALRQWAERLGTQAKLNEILQQYPAMHLRQYAEAWVAVERHRKVGQA